jgi:hypothetical protein
LWINGAVLLNKIGPIFRWFIEKNKKSAEELIDKKMEAICDLLQLATKSFPPIKYPFLFFHKFPHLPRQEGMGVHAKNGPRKCPEWKAFSPGFLAKQKGSGIYKRTTSLQSI